MKFRRCGLVMVIGLILQMAFISSLATAEKVIVWAPLNWSPGIQHSIDLAKKENPDLEIEFVTMAASQGQFVEQLVLAITAGNPPDLAWLEGTAVRDLAIKGVLADLTDILTPSKYSFVPPDLTEMKYKDRIWGIPWTTTSRGLVKRVAFFEQAGLDPTAIIGSLSELESVGAKLTVVDGAGKYTRYGFLPVGGNWGAMGWMWTFGGQLMEETANGYKVTINSPANQKAFEWIADMGGRYGRTIPGSLSFASGVVAMEAASTTNVVNYVMNNIAVNTQRVPNPPGGRNGAWGRRNSHRSACQFRQKSWRAAPDSVFRIGGGANECLHQCG